MKSRQRYALELLRRARKEDPTTDDGVLFAGATFYDTEIKVAYVNWQTAEALVRRGFLKYDWIDLDWGTSLVLTKGAV